MTSLRQAIVTRNKRALAEADAEELDELLCELRLTPDDLELGGLAFRPHRVMRQDDHGHVFEVARFGSKSAAMAEQRAFERRRHKQTYWVEPCQG